MTEARRETVRSLLVSSAPLPLRLIVGVGFVQHGYSKLVRGPEVFAAILDGMNVPWPHLMAWVTILTEVIGGLAIALGAFVVIAAVPMAIVLVVAMFTVHLPFGFSSIKLLAVTSSGPQFGPPGYEIDLLYLACLAALVLAGPGPLAIDQMIARRRISRADRQSWVGSGVGPAWKRLKSAGTSGQAASTHPRDVDGARTPTAR